METAIGIAAGIDSALRRGFSEASVRVAPHTRMTDIVASLEQLGITVTITEGVLLLAQGVTQMNTALALRSFAARPENAKYFVQEGAHPSQWSREKKIEYLSTHTDDEYRALIQSPALEADIRVLDPNMKKADYLNLTRHEKMLFVDTYGPDAVGRVLAGK